MALLKSFILLIALQIALPCSADDTSAMVKRINDRYDDFFRWHREREARWDRSRHGVDERKKMTMAREKQLEKAREVYVKTKKERPSDEALRIRHEAAEKERAAQNEMLRRRYVQQRDTAEAFLLKGRKIPELKEFDLEDY